MLEGRIDEDVLSSDLALRVCLAARSLGASSGGELAKAVGKQGLSSLKRVLPALVTAGALKERDDRRGGHATTVYLFNDAWSPLLDDLEADASIGRLEKGSRVVFVTVAALEALALLLREEPFRDSVAWVAEFDDSALGAAVVLKRSAGPGAPLALVSALRRGARTRDSEATRLSVGRILGRRSMLEWTSEVLDGPGSPRRLGP